MLQSAYYQNRSSNQLVGIPLPATTGFSSVQSNLDATVENTGWEVELSAHPIRGNKWNWSSSFNITIPKSKLLSFPGLEGSSYANTYVIATPLLSSSYTNMKVLTPALDHISLKTTMGMAK
jgi:hypothetical protein